MSPKRSRVESEQLVAELEDSCETVGRVAARGVNRKRWREALAFEVLLG